jgi:serine protease Do
MKKLGTFTSLLLAGTMTFAASVQEAQPAPKPEPRPRITRAQRSFATQKAPMARAYAYAWGGEVSGSYLGVDIRDVTSDRVKELKLKEERGVEVTMVDQDAPAAKAGLKEGDVILEFNGQRVESREQLSRMLHETPGGRTVTLGIVRNGQPTQLQATLGSRKDYMAKKVHKNKDKIVIPRIEIPEVEMPEIEVPQFEVITRMSSRSTGMMIDNLTPQLREFFGEKGGHGVLVRSVEKGSAAEAAGIKAGDVIVKVDNETIENRSDYRRALRDREGAVKIGIVRENREQTVTMNIAPRRQPRDSSLFRFEEMDGDFSDFEFDIESADHLRPAFELARPAIAGGNLRFAEDEHFGFEADFDHELEEMKHEPCIEHERPLL